METIAIKQERLHMASKISSGYLLSDHDGLKSLGMVLAIIWYLKLIHYLTEKNQIAGNEKR